MALSWQPPDRWYMQTACKGYTVAKYVVGAKTRYIAWQGKTLLAVADTAKDAQAACEDAQELRAA